jgi:hypothetical protein
MQARRCLDEGTDEAWQIENESQPVNPRWRRNAAQTPFLRPPNPDSSIVAPLRVFDGAHSILALRDYSLAMLACRACETGAVQRQEGKRGEGRSKFRGAKTLRYQ